MQDINPFIPVPQQPEIRGETGNEANSLQQQSYSSEPPAARPQKVPTNKIPYAVIPLTNLGTVHNLEFTVLTNNPHLNKHYVSVAGKVYRALTKEVLINSSTSNQFNYQVVNEQINKLEKNPFICMTDNQIRNCSGINNIHRMFESYVGQSSVAAPEIIGTIPKAQSVHFFITYRQDQAVPSSGSHPSGSKESTEVPVLNSNELHDMILKSCKNKVVNKDQTFEVFLSKRWFTVKIEGIEGARTGGCNYAFVSDKTKITIRTPGVDLRRSADFLFATVFYPVDQTEYTDFQNKQCTWSMSLTISVAGPLNGETLFLDQESLKKAVIQELGTRHWMQDATFSFPAELEGPNPASQGRRKIWCVKRVQEERERLEEKKANGSCSKDSSNEELARKADNKRKAKIDAQKTTKRQRLADKPHLELDEDEEAIEEEDDFDDYSQGSSSSSSSTNITVIVTPSFPNGYPLSKVYKDPYADDHAAYQFSKDLVSDLLNNKRRDTTTFTILNNSFIPVDLNKIGLEKGGDEIDSVRVVLLGRKREQSPSFTRDAFPCNSCDFPTVVMSEEELAPVIRESLGKLPFYDSELIQFEIKEQTYIAKIETASPNPQVNFRNSKISFVKFEDSAKLSHLGEHSSLEFSCGESSGIEVVYKNEEMQLAASVELSLIGSHFSYEQTAIVHESDVILAIRKKYQVLFPNQKITASVVASRTAVGESPFHFAVNQISAAVSAANPQAGRGRGLKITGDTVFTISLSKETRAGISHDRSKVRITNGLPDEIDEKANNDEGINHDEYDRGDRNIFPDRHHESRNDVPDVRADGVYFHRHHGRSKTLDILPVHQEALSSSLFRQMSVDDAMRFIDRRWKGARDCKDVEKLVQALGARVGKAAVEKQRILGQSGAPDSSVIGILIEGIIGTGKTTLGVRLAEMLVRGNPAIYQLNYSGIASPYIMEASKLMSQSMDYLLQCPGDVVLLLDKMDLFLPNQGNRFRESGHTQEMLGAFIAELKKLAEKKNGKVFVIGTTSHSTLIDNAVRNQFDYRVSLAYPSAPTQEEILKMSFDLSTLPNYTGWQDLAPYFDGFTGEDINKVIKGLISFVLIREAAKQKILDESGQGGIAAEKISLDDFRESAKVVLEQKVKENPYRYDGIIIRPKQSIQTMSLEASYQFVEEQVGGLTDSMKGFIKEIWQLYGDSSAVARNLSDSDPNPLPTTKGAVLHGPPGTGKTSFARAIAGLCTTSDIQVRFLSGSDFSKADGFDSAAPPLTRFKHFLTGNEVGTPNPPLRIFILDEGEVLMRGAIYSELKSYLSGEGKGSKNTIFFITTNSIQALPKDEALTRSGRLSHIIHVDLPTEEARKKILKSKLKLFSSKLSNLIVQDVDSIVQEVAKHTPNFSGADLTDCAYKACLNASSQGGRLTASSFDESIQFMKNKLAKVDWIPRLPIISSDVSHRRALFVPPDNENIKKLSNALIGIEGNTSLTNFLSDLSLLYFDDSFYAPLVRGVLISGQQKSGKSTLAKWISQSVGCSEDRIFFVDTKAPKKKGWKEIFLSLKGQVQPCVLYVENLTNLLKESSSSSSSPEEDEDLLKNLLKSLMGEEPSGSSEQPKLSNSADRNYFSSDQYTPFDFANVLLVGTCDSAKPSNEKDLPRNLSELITHFIHLEVPDHRARQAIIEDHLMKTKLLLAQDLSTSTCSSMFAGLTAYEIHKKLDRAAAAALRENKLPRTIEMRHVSSLFGDYITPQKSEYFIPPSESEIKAIETEFPMIEGDESFEDLIVDLDGFDPQQKKLYPVRGILITGPSSQDNERFADMLSKSLGCGTEGILLKGEKSPSSIQKNVESWVSQMSNSEELKIFRVQMQPDKPEMEQRARSSLAKQVNKNQMEDDDEELHLQMSEDLLKKKNKMLIIATKVVSKEEAKISGDFADHAFTHLIELKLPNEKERLKIIKRKIIELESSFDKRIPVSIHPNELNQIFEERSCTEIKWVFAQVKEEFERNLKKLKLHPSSSTSKELRITEESFESVLTGKQSKAYQSMYT